MKIDWLKAKTDYISNPQETLLSISGKYNISLSQVEKTAASEGWKELRQKTAGIVQEKLPEKLGDKIAEIKARHASIGKMYQGMAVQSLQEKDKDGKPVLKAKTIEEATLVGMRGISIERQALDLQEEKTPAVAIQINFGSPEVAEWGK